MSSQEGFNHTASRREIQPLSFEEYNRLQIECMKASHIALDKWGGDNPKDNDPYSPGALFADYINNAKDPSKLNPQQIAVALEEKLQELGKNDWLTN